MEITKPKQTAGRGITREKISGPPTINYPRVEEYVEEHKPQALALASVREWADDIRKEEKIHQKKEWKKRERGELLAWWSVFVVLCVLYFPVLIIPLAVLASWGIILLFNMIVDAFLWVWHFLTELLRNGL